MRKWISVVVVSLLAASFVVGGVGSAVAAPESHPGVCETTTTAGGGTLDLSGTPATGGYVKFADKYSSGATVSYILTTGLGASRKIEIGQGVFTDASPDTLTRATVYMTTDVPAGGTPLTLAAGTHTVCAGPVPAWFQLGGGSTSWSPNTTDGAALGTASLNWSDIFLASGAVINFNNGNYTITHSAGNLTFAGGPITAPLFVPNSSTVPTNGLYLPASNTLGFGINSAAEISLTATAFSPAVSDGNALGTTSLQWSDLHLAEGAVINFDNGDCTIAQTGDDLLVSGCQIVGQRTGEFFWYTGSTCPSYAVQANGGTLSRGVYTRLWNAISGDAVAQGSKDDADYGTGDGSTTFTLINVTGSSRFIRGGTYGTAQASGLPNVTGQLNGFIGTNSSSSLSGAMTGTAQSTALFNATSPAGWRVQNLGFDLSNGNAIYGASSTVQPPNITLTPCIVF